MDCTLVRHPKGIKQLCSRSFIFSSGGVLDWFVSHQYLPQISLMLAGAIVSAAVGLLFLETVSEAHERHKSVVRWLQRIAELNHHIRNALQIITFNNVAERGTEAIKRVDSAVTRIESALREASPSPRFKSLRQMIKGTPESSPSPYL